MNPNMKMQTLEDGRIEIRTFNNEKALDIIKALDTVEFDYALQVRTASSKHDNTSRIGVTREYVFTLDTKQYAY